MFVVHLGGGGSNGVLLLRASVVFVSTFKHFLGLYLSVGSGSFLPLFVSPAFTVIIFVVEKVF